MLIGILSDEYSAHLNVMAYADDFSAAGNLQNLRWCSVLAEIWYYPEPRKT